LYWVFGRKTGAGNSEAITAPGDSGGPLIVDNQIAGIVVGGVSSMETIEMINYRAKATGSQAALIDSITLDKTENGALSYFFRLKSPESLSLIEAAQASGYDIRTSSDQKHSTQCVN
jgi:hypothetical protein